MQGISCVGCVWLIEKIFQQLPGARDIVVNGAGYDPLALKFIDANPVPGRRVLTVADLLGKKAGDNPHFWYNPEWVDRVADRITADFQALDPADAAYFSQQRVGFQIALQPYRDAIAHITAMLESRLLQHAIGARFALNDIVAAHEAVEQSRFVGHVVVSIP